MTSQGFDVTGSIDYCSGDFIRTAQYGPGMYERRRGIRQRSDFPLCFFRSSLRKFGATAQRGGGNPRKCSRSVRHEPDPRPQ